MWPSPDSDLSIRLAGHEGPVQTLSQWFTHTPKALAYDIIPSTNFGGRCRKAMLGACGLPTRDTISGCCCFCCVA